MERSDKSKSFMREHDFIGICNEEDEDDAGFYIDKKGVQKDSQLNLDEVFKKTSSDKLLLQKKTLLKLTAEKGMNRNVVVNAINLQDYSINQIKRVIQQLTEELRRNKVKGILEFHANDTTQSSYHFHFWTWEHYEIKARAVITDFILDNNYANYNNVKIEGNFTRQINKDSTEEEKIAIKEANKSSKINLEEEQRKSTFKIITSEEKIKERFRLLNEAIKKPIFEKTSAGENEPKKVPSLIKEEANKKEPINIFDKLLKQAKQQKRNYSYGNVTVLSKAEDYNIDDSFKKIEALKSKLKIFK